MFSTFYNIDLKKAVRWNVPRSKRYPKRLAKLYALTYAASQIFQQLLRFRKQKLYQLEITSQVCYLERLLNDKWDYTLRRIRIVDGIDHPPFYIYRNNELKPKYIRRKIENAPRYIYTRGESGVLSDDFVVKVPMGIAFDYDEMRSLLNAFKLGGIKFKIQIV